MHKIKKSIVSIMLFLSILTISALADTASNAGKVITVKAQTIKTVLNYNGTLLPISSVPVLSPIDGTVTAMHFHFGADIKKGEPLFTLDSSTLEKNYRDAIKSFLQAKQDLDTKQQDYQTNILLKKAGVLSQDALTQSQIDVENSRITLLQARFSLEKVLQKTHIKIQQIETLKLTDANQVNQVLSQRLENIKVSAPATGVALFPTQSQEQQSSSGASSVVHVGSSVKTGNFLVSIGDLSGFSTSVKVSEININKIQEGQKVTITGNAFPGIKLKGVVDEVDSQAQQSGDSSGVSLFKIYIKIPHVSKHAKKLIHVGMTSAINIKIINSAHIVIPIAAVSTANNNSTVQLVTGTGTQTVPVLTGSTTPTGVVILHGLKDGDKILLSLDRGDLINKTFEDFSKDNKIVFAWLNGIGAIEDPEVGFYCIDEKSYHRKQFQGEYELTSLIGNITLRNEKCYSHTEKFLQI